MQNISSSKTYLSGPFPAQLLNQTTQDIECWTSNPSSQTGNTNYFIVKPFQTSPDGVDVDHFKDLNGQWWKCGENLFSTRLVIIEPSGKVIYAECKVSGAGKACGQ